MWDLFEPAHQQQADPEIHNDTESGIQQAWSFLLQKK